MGTLENRLITTLVQLRNRRNQRLLQQQMNAGFGNQNQQLQQQLQVNSGFGNQNQQFVQHGIPTAGGFLGGCQQPSSVFPTTSGSNNMVSSMSDGERISSQMMPTPGFVNTNDTDAYSSLESTMVAGQKFGVDHNNCIFISQTLQSERSFKQQQSGDKDTFLAKVSFITAKKHEPEADAKG
ncbi:hypothetical protein POM88_048886 [Heracleum sosnowskyi]|uniref:Uncharacterized protein n=1 Tax=Heracleum sosnowskyi TaxID=360622 RepID=A0AAD8GX68_9APIA|nr:hypothetical protein POM88_048886 [Heracleum sosnowskyi]